MNASIQPDSGLTALTIERELDLVATGIEMVASRGAPGLSLLGLAFGPAIADRLEKTALANGVVLERLWHVDDSGCDIHVRSREPWPDYG